jgi:hypothetical protein
MENQTIEYRFPLTWPYTISWFIRSQAEIRILKLFIQNEEVSIEAYTAL